jgi:flagellin
MAMGLRINTNISGIRALRNLHINDRNQQNSLERLSTGLRINRAADDPSGLVISERLRAQINGQQQAVENTQNATNLMSVADSALQQVSNLLVDIQGSVVFAQNTGGSSPEQIAAEQDSVDQAIAAIDRIGATTRYADRSLLNGTAQFTPAAALPDEINDLRIRSMSFPNGVTQRDIDFNVTTVMTRGGEDGATDLTAAATADTVLRVQGSRGTKDVFIGSGATAAQTVDSINSAAGDTGVYATATGAFVQLFTEEFGSDETVTTTVVSGAIAGGGATSTGVDAVVSFEGQSITGDGNHVKINSSTTSLEFTLDPDPGVVAAGAIATITINNTGLTFQLAERSQPSDRITVGLDAINSSTLGSDDIYDVISDALLTAGGPVFVAPDQRKGGFLSSMTAGSANDLATNPANASEIIAAAIDQVSTQRAFLGAVQGFNLEPNADTLAVSIENLSASVSDIRDLDFAEETSNFTKTQILFQAGTAVLASANLIPQTVLTLLR